MLTRREFSSSLAAFLIGQRWLDPFSGDGAPPLVLRVGLMLPVSRTENARDIADISAGVHLALVENQRAADLFGQRLQLFEMVFADDKLRQSADDLVHKKRADVIIGGSSTSEAKQLGDLAGRLGFLFFNVGATDDSLRRTACDTMMYHIAASDAMIASAKRAAGSAEPDIKIEVWHSTLERYGASQLNDRYKDRFGRAMSSHAWTGWFALKLAWESSLRARNLGESVIGPLMRQTIHFDGHKGAPLNFRPWDHQLRQPLYAVSRSSGVERVFAELPDVGRDSNEPIVEQLDKFGDPVNTDACHFITL